MESDDSMSVLLPMVSLMLLLVFAGGLWFLRTRNQLRARPSHSSPDAATGAGTVTRLDLERGEAQAERWKCSVCEFSNAMDRPTCMLCGTKNSKREELPRLKQSIAGRDERLSSTSSITMLTRPSLTAQRQKYARRRKEWVRCLGEDGESAFWTRADVAAAARRLTVVNGAANHGTHGRVSVGFVTHMVRRSSMIGDVGRLTFADVSQLDAAETISGYNSLHTAIPQEYTWFLERMGALAKTVGKREHILVESMEQLLGIQPEHIHFPFALSSWAKQASTREVYNEMVLHSVRDHLLYFRGIGRLLGRALLEGQTMQARLCLPILKHFLGTPITFSDLQYVDPEVYTSMLWIRDNDGVDALELTFCVTELRADDEVITIDLVPDGRDKPVTDANKVEFLHLKLRYLMLDRYAPQLQALSLGLFEIIPQEALLVFDYQSWNLYCVACQRSIWPIGRATHGSRSQLQRPRWSLTGSGSDPRLHGRRTARFCSSRRVLRVYQCKVSRD
ncbi:Zinc finger, RanBP2-type [Phytophthora cactorum]|nr:Zinc finger, RanBP2-type [Phytophthora cactorum]